MFAINVFVFNQNGKHTCRYCHLKHFNTSSPHLVLGFKIHTEVSEFISHWMASPVLLSQQ